MSFRDSDPHALISIACYYCFNVETHAEFPGRVVLSVHDIVGGVVRDHDLVAILKIVKIFPGVW